MLFKITRQALLPALKAAFAAADTKATIPILSHVLVRHTEGAIEVIGTDTETEISTCVNVTGSFDANDYGEITVPAAKLYEIVRNLPTDAELTFFLKGEKVEIKSGKSRFTLSTLSSDDFPSSAAIENATTFTLNALILKEYLVKIAHAMAYNDARYYLNGVCLDMWQEGLNLVATDGHRLSLVVTSDLMFADEQRQVILPHKFVTELTKLLGDDDDVKILVNDSHIQVKLSNHLMITSKLIDGKYPDYQGIIPKPKFWMGCDVAGLKKALEQAAILSNEKYNGVRLILSSNRLKVTASNPNNEESEIELEVNFSGDDIEIGFNVEYLLDALSALSTQTVEIGLTDGNSSCLIQNEGDDSARHIIMPMRL